MNKINIIISKELLGYFLTPVAYVFLIIFIAAIGAFTFFLGGFFTRGQADLQPFFSFHPWLYLFLIPAIGMRLWAEERKSGTIELLMTLPVSTMQVVLGKFFAAWIFTLISLFFTFPIWITVNYLGNPDNGVIIASYIGSLLMAGAFISLVSCISALTKNQVIAFIISVAISFIFLMSGVDLVLSLFKSWSPDWVVSVVSSLSILTNFQQITKGVIDMREVIFFFSMISFFLFLNIIIVDIKKSE
ncbi:ABC transporter permease [Alphaproteobacteria bacterium]|nr:ABC transporter permease [Alphaproteobacteria bacterium]